LDSRQVDGVRFADFTLDYGRRQLLRAGADVHLSPKAYQLLTLLVTNRPKAISKDAIIAHLWPDTFVSEVNLPALIAELRTALQDAPRDSRFIRTVYSFGYAFCAETQPVMHHGADRIRSAAAFLLWKGKRFDVIAPETVIGRGPEAGIRLESTGVSRRHARIVLEGSHAIVEDLGSKNGTYVGPIRIIGPHVLADGDRVRLGSIVLTFKVDSSRSTETLGEQPA
jgi:DNA-binding winged helix-turn-helix (wHTH) protein